MRTIQTSATFPLDSVKPLEGLLRYRGYCLEATRQVLAAGKRRRARSPVGGSPLEPYGSAGELSYVRCPETGSLFLAEVAEPERWAALLQDVSRHRFSQSGFYPGLAQSRADHVYAPKLEWIRDTLRLQGLHEGRMLEVTTAPSTFTHLLEESALFAEIEVADEMALAHAAPARSAAGRIQAATLLESLDRVDEPAALIQAVVRRLEEGGLLFVTALVCSGFDFALLGDRNLYLCPPDRTNCFTLEGLSRLLRQAGCSLIEVSTPGVLDVEIVRAHLQHDPAVPLSAFERQLIEADTQAHEELQAFLQRQRLSSFARMVGRKTR